MNDFAHTHDLPEPYTRGFGILKDEIDPAAPHDMASIRANIAKWRKILRNTLVVATDVYKVWNDEDDWEYFEVDFDKKHETSADWCCIVGK